ncbi:nucleoside recognition domain-containing protein [Paenibacillus validus]|uniref:nucleoside recognition domain-containing protein n=1 Tax=Paenibacillus validus TaxID=44253 RepID=UPI000FD70560|nr:nucleoside recognition domain-containing protein [Paenibacillus validus]
MPRLSSLFSPKFTTLLLGASALALVISIILFPDLAFQSSLQGLQLWWKLVFPALLPFLILTEMLRGLGALHALGVLLEPLFRILFRVPGIGGFVMAIAFTAGMPAGAAAIGGMRKDGQLTRDEGERLLAVSHLLSPVILISVVGVGFLHSAPAGLALAVIHYGSALLMALAHRLRAERASEARSVYDTQPGERGFLSRFWHTLEDARSRDGRTFGKLLGDAVSSGVQQLFVIGGYMMMFSVLLQAIPLTGMIDGLTSIVVAVVSDIGQGEAASLLTALMTGIIEPHLGAYAMTQQVGPPGSASSLGYAALSALLAWGGLSTHAQVRSFTAATDLRFVRFLSARLQHGGIAFVLTLVAWRPLLQYFQEGAAVSTWAPIAAWNGGWSLEQNQGWPFISPMMLQFGSVLLVMLVLSVFAAFLFRRGRGRKA